MHSSQNSNLICLISQNDFVITFIQVNTRRCPFKNQFLVRHLVLCLECIVLLLSCISPLPLSLSLSLSLSHSLSLPLSLSPTVSLRTLYKNVLLRKFECPNYHCFRFVHNVTQLIHSKTCPMGSQFSIFQSDLIIYLWPIESIFIFVCQVFITIHCTRFSFISIMYLILCILLHHRVHCKV